MTNKNKNKSFPLAALLALGAAYFITGTSGMSVVGLALPISGSLKVPDSDIAYLVLSFAITFAVVAPLAQVFLGKLPRFKILLLGLTVMGTGMAIGAAVNSFEALFYSRILLGVGGGLITPMCSAIGAGLAAPAQQGKAMSIVFAGLTIASVAGVPISAYLGTIFGWRPVLAGISVATFIVALLVLVLVKDRTSGDEISLKHILQAFTARQSSLPLFTTYLQMTALFCTYALVAPYVTGKFSVSAQMVAFIIFVYGFFGVIGNTIAGIIVDKLGTKNIISISFTGILAAFILLWVVPGELVYCLLAFALIALFGMGFHSPQQQRIANINPAKRSLYLALNAALLYLGIASGSWISNLVAVHIGYEYLPVSSALVLVICIWIFYLSLRTKTTVQET